MDNLMAAFDADPAAGPHAQWRSFSVAVLHLAVERGLPQGGPGVAVVEAWRAWEAASVDAKILEETRVAIWDYLKTKHGDSSTVKDSEDGALRVAIGGLWPVGNRDAAFESAGWIEDMLTGGVG